MKVFTKDNVLEATQKRLDYIFRKFKNDEIVVNFSGGKDSRVLLHLAYLTAQKYNKPFYIYFFDEEAILNSTYEIVKECMKMYSDLAIPLWFQVQTTYHIASNFKMEIVIWDKNYEDLWIRKKEDIAIKELKKFEEPIFMENVHKALTYEAFGNKRVAKLISIRSEESIRRQLSIFKGAFDGVAYYSTKADAIYDGDYYNFYPLYDWRYNDVWKAIYDFKLNYDKSYDMLFLLGFDKKKMRVSSILDVKSIKKTLAVLRILEPETYDKLVKRFSGVKGFARMLEDRQLPIKISELKLPLFFKSWREYCEYLLLNLEFGEEELKSFKNCFNDLYKFYQKILLKGAKVDLEEIFKIFCYTLLTYDTAGQYIDNWIDSTRAKLWRAGKW